MESAACHRRSANLIISGISSEQDAVRLAAYSNILAHCCYMAMCNHAVSQAKTLHAVAIAAPTTDKLSCNNEAVSVRATFNECGLSVHLWSLARHHKAPVANQVDGNNDITSM
jgi:hypothetical protein